MEPLYFTCNHCRRTEIVDDDSIQEIVNRRREQVMGMLSNDGGRHRGVLAFDQVTDPDTGEKKLVARRRLPGVEVKEG